MGAGVTAAATLSLIACAIAWGRAAASMGVFAWACRCFGARARLQSGDDFGLQWLARVLLDGMHSTLIAPLGEGDGQAVAPSAARAANAVGVVFGLHGQTEVEHVGNGGHIDAACSHVGGNQELHAPIAQGAQAAVA